MSKKVLVVIDMQKDFLEPDGKLSLGKDTTELKARVAQRMREFDGDVIATLDTHRENASEFSQFPPHCVKGTDGWFLSDEIAEALEEVGGETIQKYSFAGGAATDLLNSDYDEYEFVGVCTHICVHDSIAALYHESKEDADVVPTITVRKELVDDFNDEMAEGALKRMETLYNVKVV